MINFGTFGERLKQAREDNNLTVRILGEQIGVSGATISRYEKGVHEPTRATIDQLSEILGINPAWLMGANVEKFLSDIDTRSRPIPILGVIAAGLSIYAQENVQGWEYVTDNTDFCLRVKGDSMIGARIHDGDIVFIRKQSDVDNGEIAAILIEDEVTLKRVYKKDTSLILHSENPTYPDRIFFKKDLRELKILGKVKYVKFEAR
jgi:repressor LexA